MNLRAVLRTFLRPSLPLVPAIALVIVIVGLSQAQAQQGTVQLPANGVLTRITNASGAGRESLVPSISGDGSKIAFISDSDFLGHGIPAQQYEVWLYDTTSQQLTQVTTSTHPTRYSSTPHISADGSKLAFASDADFVNEGIPDDQQEIWLYDVISGTLSRVTTASHSGRDSLAPNLNADATKLAFFSDSDFLAESIPAGQREIWVFDVLSGTLNHVTKSPFSDRMSVTPRMNADGKRIAFASDSDFLGEGIAKEDVNIWLYDADTMTVTRISSVTTAVSYWPNISADGTRIAYRSGFDIWLYDTQALAYTRITTAPHPLYDSSLPSISADGGTIAYQSRVDFPGQTLVQDNYDIWLYDVPSASYTRVTSGTSGTENSAYAALNDDGSHVVFHSNADLLAEGLTADRTEIWMYGPSPFEHEVYVPVFVQYW